MSEISSQAFNYSAETQGGRSSTAESENPNAQNQPEKDWSWGGELTAIVSANAHRIVRCPWLDGAAVTVGRAMGAYNWPPDLTAADEPYLISVVESLLAYEVREDEEPETEEEKDEVEAEESQHPPQEQGKRPKPKDKPQEQKQEAKKAEDRQEQKREPANNADKTAEPQVIQAGKAEPTEKENAKLAGPDKTAGQKHETDAPAKPAAKADSQAKPQPPKTPGTVNYEKPMPSFAMPKPAERAPAAKDVMSAEPPKATARAESTPDDVLPVAITPNVEPPEASAAPQETLTEQPALKHPRSADVQGESEAASQPGYDEAPVVEVGGPATDEELAAPEFLPLEIAGTEDLAEPDFEPELTIIEISEAPRDDSEELDFEIPTQTIHLEDYGEGEIVIAHPNETTEAEISFETEDDFVAAEFREMTSADTAFEAEETVIALGVPGQTPNEKVGAAAELIEQLDASQPETAEEPGEIVEALTALEETEPEAADRREEIIGQTIRTTYEPESAGAEQETEEEPIEAEVEELVYELAARLEIILEPKVARSLAGLVADLRYSEERTGLTEITPGASAHDYGTHELIKSLLISYAASQKASVWASALGSSALQLYSFSSSG